MLSSIHPLGERAKHNSYAVTAGSFVVGAVAGGLLVGSVAGAAALVLSAAIDRTAAVVAFAVLALLAAFAEWRGIRLPSWRRQVNEDWLTTYRGWVYGLGFGFQLGAGVLTIITSAAVPLALLGAVLTGSWTAAVAVGAVLGLARGASILVTAGIDDPDRLWSFHRELQERAPAVRSLASAALTVTGFGVLAGGLV